MNVSANISEKYLSLAEIQRDFRELFADDGCASQIEYQAALTKPSAEHKSKHYVLMIL